MGMLKDTLDTFLPPIDADPSLQQRWRYMIASGMTGLVLAVTCLYIITARAADVRDLAAVSYIPAIQGAHRQLCLTDDPRTKDQLRRLLVDQKKKYLEITAEQFPEALLENCNVIRRRNGLPEE